MIQGGLVYTASLFEISEAILQSIDDLFILPSFFSPYSFPLSLRGLLQFFLLKCKSTETVEVTYDLHLFLNRQTLLPELDVCQG